MSDSPKLKVIEGHVYASSLDIAKTFSKHHFHVIEAIENTLNASKKRGVEPTDLEIIKEFSLVNFDESNYTDRKGETRKIYNMTRDGFAIVAMGFTGAKAQVWKIRYINEFNRMERELQTRNLKNQHDAQFRFDFPECADTFDKTRQSMTVTYALGRLTECGLMIPPVSRQQIINLIKRQTLDGFNDGRTWHIYADSFNRFLELRARRAA